MKNISYLEFKIENLVGYSNPEDGENYSDLNVKIMNDGNVIGTMNAVIFDGCFGEEVYEALDNHSLDYSALTDGIRYDEDTDEYLTPWEENDEYYASDKFIAIGEILINEEYRGLGITKRLIEWVDGLFNAPMILKAFPLQYCTTKNPNPPKTGLPKARKKVIDAYLKCGFEKVSPKSDILYRTPNF